jgi:hypothetical protein
MNLLPLVILLIPGSLLLRTTGFPDRRAMPYLLLPLFTFSLGCFACSDYTIGRITLHAMPFLIAPVAWHLQAAASRHSTQRLTSRPNPSSQYLP